MANFCLPKQYTAIFLKALQDGSINPEQLRNMSSEQRRGVFSGILGEDNAKEVNALFESKLLLKDQQKGMIDWAKSVSGLTEPVRKNIMDRIQSMENVLQPDTEHDFLADLAAQKLNATVTVDEARQIFKASQKVQNLKDVMLSAGNIDYQVSLKDFRNPIGALKARINYGRALLDLIDLVNSFKPDGRTFLQKLIDVANIPKSMLTSIFHFSAPFVQGWGMMSTARAWEAFSEMFRYFADEENFQNLRAYIVSHPDYGLARDGKLRITDLSDKLSDREEALQSALVEKANKYLSDKTGVPNLVRASGRAFTGYLNYVRFNRFTDLLTAARMNGEDVRIGSPVVRDLAKVVNDFTGAGAVGVKDNAANIVPALNIGLFSPRKISATMQMFEPIHYMKPSMSPTARIAAFRQLGGSILATYAITSLAAAMGFSVNFNPLSQDFLKIQIGKEKLDVTGGNAIYVRLLSRILTGKEVTSKGETINLGEQTPDHRPITRADLMLQYVRNKLAPVAGILVDHLYGADPVGRPFNVTQEARDKLAPIAINSILQSFQSNPDDAVSALPALASLLGVGVESPLPPPARMGMSVWGEPVGTFSDPVRNDVDKEFERLGFTPGFPPQTIKGIKLTDKQYGQYISRSGFLAKQLLDNMIHSPDWTNIPDKMKLSIMKSQIQSSRTSAQSSIEAESYGSDNDILTQSLQKKINP